MAVETLLTPEYIAKYSKPRSWQDLVLTDFLDWTVSRHPDREVFIDRWGRLTYGHLGEMVDQAALGLLELGIGPGDIVALQLPNWHHFPVFHCALTRIGAITTNMPTGLRQREVCYILAFTRAKAIVVPSHFRDFDHLDLIDQLRPELPHFKYAIVVGGQARQGVVAYEELIATNWSLRRDRSTLASLRPDPNSVTFIGFTSGTTGNPKGAMHTSNTLGAMPSVMTAAFDLTDRDVIYMGSPVGHHLGFWIGTRLPIVLGGKTILHERWVPSEAVALIAKEGATFTSASTTFLHDLVYSPDLDLHDRLPTLRAFVCGGAPVPVNLLRDAGERLPHTFVSSAFGMTENGILTVVTPTAPRYKVLESEGCPFPGYSEVKVVGPDGAELPHGEKGELLCRSAEQSVGYYLRPDLNAELYEPDGFFHTGDQAYMDSDGYIRITGRIKDLIIRGGENIAPAEIENLLISHPQVAAVSVIGMPDSRLGERICAYIVPKEGESIALEDVTRLMAEHDVEKKKWPERLELVEELPRTPAGKVQKFILRQWLAAKMDEEKTSA